MRVFRYNSDTWFCKLNYTSGRWGTVAAKQKLSLKPIAPLKGSIHGFDIPIVFLNLTSQKFPIFELLSWQRYVGNGIPGLFRRSCRLCCKVLHNLNVHGKKAEIMKIWPQKQIYCRKSARDAEIAERAWQRHAAIFVIFFLFILITIVVMVISSSIILYIYRVAVQGV